MEMRIDLVEKAVSSPLMMRWLLTVGSKMLSVAEVVPLSLDYSEAILRWRWSCMQRS